MPSFEKVVPVLRMFDPRKTLEFYVDFLGFEVDSAGALCRVDEGHRTDARYVRDELAHAAPQPLPEGHRDLGIVRGAEGGVPVRQRPPRVKPSPISGRNMVQANPAAQLCCRIRFRQKTNRMVHQLGRSE